MKQSEIPSYPLCWPVGYPRTKRKKPSQFDTSFADARDGLINELRLLRARQVIISTNIRTYRRGGLDIPYADQKRVDDAGVAVYFVLNGEQHVFACDKWNRVRDNLQAVRKTVAALRGLDRWGVSEMLKRAFTGFKALPPATNGQPWHVVLGVEPTARVDAIRRAFRKRAHETHPDRPGGSVEAFQRVQAAYEEALRIRAHAPA